MRGGWGFGFERAAVEAVVAVRRQPDFAQPALRYLLADSSSLPEGSRPMTPRRLSHAASLSEGSALTSSRIISHATIFNAPSGGMPIANDTAHCGQKQIRCAVDF